MRFRALLASIVVGLMVWSAMFAYQQRHHVRSFDEEDDPAPIPPDANEKTEFSFARIRYKDAPVMGWRRGNWTIDYPKADRQFLQGVRRLTRIHTRSMEEVVDFEG